VHGGPSPSYQIGSILTLELTQEYKNRGGPIECKEITARNQNMY
jgi:hypothetical protein